MTMRAAGIRSLGIFLFVSQLAWAEVKFLSPTDLAPPNGSFFNWSYEKDAKVLFFPVLYSSRLKAAGESQLDALREEGQRVLRRAFPQMTWTAVSDFPANKKGPLKRTGVNLNTMASFAVQACQAEHARTGLIALMDQVVLNNVPLFQCELLVVDAEASCQVTQVIGWSRLDDGLAGAMTKAADLLAEQPLFVVRPKIPLSPVVNEKGKRTGASLPVGSRVGILLKSRLAILGKDENGLPQSLGNLEVVEEGVTSSLCKISNVPKNADLPEGTLCVPVDEDTYKSIRPSK